MKLSENQDPEVLNTLDKYLPKGLMQYCLTIDGGQFEGFANHTDSDIKLYDMQMNLVKTLDKAEIRIVHMNPNDVLGIISNQGSIYLER